ncbi:uncharacterized protein LOC111246921 isoform X1 [Varroa destructor]|uniref:Uncharacterized protein n=1 Tax=Varroa destructor TaxID=109461 RepID=A0A7M7JVB4_VARDE|nr:uncharacterized protein LOC111246921 isoform X1 [Varroa destructor]
MNLPHFTVNCRYSFLRRLRSIRSCRHLGNPLTGSPRRRNNISRNGAIDDTGAAAPRGALAGLTSGTSNSVAGAGSGQGSAGVSCSHSVDSGNIGVWHSRQGHRTEL